MATAPGSFPPDLSALSRADWLAALRRIGQERGFAEALGKAHAGLFVEDGDTLLVTFESMSGIEALSETRTPFGFEMVASRGWSCADFVGYGCCGGPA